jgi:hypothetical protein
MRPALGSSGEMRPPMPSDPSRGLRLRQPCGIILRGRHALVVFLLAE